MVCKNQEQHIAIQWDDENVYGFVAEPTEYQRQIVNAVNKLPLMCRKVVILFAFEGIRRGEIAEIMTTSLAAVRFLIHHGGLLLQEHLSVLTAHGDAAQDLRLKKMFSDWPYGEYAKLVELQKYMVFLE